MSSQIRIYRTYNFVDKDPIIDRVRTVIQDEGLINNLQAVSDMSGVSTLTLHNWFHGATRRPQHATLAAVATALKYDIVLQRRGNAKLNVEREINIAHRWRAEQRKMQEQRRKRKNI